nr:hypothetical protein OG409_20520 [Streptomyces sp. NBC_00974]
MPGPALPPCLAALLWAPLIVLAPAAAAPAATVSAATATAPARASPVGTAEGLGDIALAIGVTTAAAAATGLWLRSRHRREDAEALEGTEGGDP